ncbi:MAG: cell division protein ZapA [Paludibacter sp.]|nr:cell division protein ZapA [Paludibacter sp.]
MDKNEFKIHVQIGGFRIPLNIPRKDEEIYRRAEKLVVKYLDEFQKIYRQRATEEILILVAFRLAVALSKQGMNNDLVPMAEKIKSLDEELKQLLAKQD